MSCLPTFTGERELNEAGFCLCQFSITHGRYVCRYGEWTDTEDGTTRVEFLATDTLDESVMFSVLLHGSEFKAARKSDFDRAALMGGRT